MRLAIKIKNAATANQLASLVHSNDMFSCDGSRTFKIGNTALFWLHLGTAYPHQYTAEAFPLTLEHVPDSMYGTANTLATALDTRI